MHASAALQHCVFRPNLNFRLPETTAWKMASVRVYKVSISYLASISFAVQESCRYGSKYSGVVLRLKELTVKSRKVLSVVQVERVHFV